MKNITLSIDDDDTNLFAYSIDQGEPEKKDKARAILNKVVDSPQPVISTQVTKEFHIGATTKLNAEQCIVKNIIYKFHNMEIVDNYSI